MFDWYSRGTCQRRRGRGTALLGRNIGKFPFEGLGPILRCAVRLIDGAFDAFDGLIFCLIPPLNSSAVRPLSLDQKGSLARARRDLFKKDTFGDGSQLFAVKRLEGRDPIKNQAVSIFGSWKEVGT